jgi:hypothetical protein
VLPLGTTSVSYIATKASANGKATVALTGQSNTTVDLYNSSTVYKQTVYTSPALSASTQYTLTISYSGTKNASSTGFKVDVDEITGTLAATYTQGPLLTTAPHVILTDTGCGASKDYPPTQVPTLTQGALANPGLPDSTFTVCVDNGTNNVTITGVHNTNLAAGTTVTADIYPGGGGSGGGGTGVYGTGVCT